MDFEQIFPHRYYLNLARRQDRRAQTEVQFREIDLEVQRFPAVDASWLQSMRGYETKPRYALALTTRMLLRKAMREKASALLIFEDDVVLAPDFVERVSELELPDDWAMFYLGTQHHLRPTTVEKGLVKVGYALDAHAYAIRGPYLERVYRLLKGAGKKSANGQFPAIDVSLGTLHAEIPTYAAYPNLAWQGVEDSDIAKGRYSNYGPTGDQLPHPEILAGLGAEALGGKASVGAGRRVSNFVFQVRRWFPNWQPPVHTLRTAEAEPTAADARPGHAVIFREMSVLSPQDEFKTEWENWAVAANERVSVVELLLTDDVWNNLRLRLDALRKAAKEWNLSGVAFLPKEARPLRSAGDFLKLLELSGPSIFEWEMMFPANHTKAAENVSSGAGSSDVDFGLIRYSTQFIPSAWSRNSGAVVLSVAHAKALIEEDYSKYCSWIKDDPWCYYPSSVLRLKGFDLEQTVLGRNPVFTPAESNAASAVNTTAMAWASGNFFEARPEITNANLPTLTSLLKS